MLIFHFFFFFNDTATTEIYTLSLHDALPISSRAAELVDAAYQGLLARAPDEQALGHYSAQLAEHKDLAGLLANLSESQEHWAQLLALRSEDLVRCVYRALLNREPDEEALRSYAEHVRQDRSRI